MAPSSSSSSNENNENNDNDDNDDSDSDSSSDNEQAEPNWDILKETLGSEALAALQQHYQQKDTDTDTVVVVDHAATESTTTESTITESTTALPSNNREYGKHDYWEERFTQEEEFDWLVTYNDIAVQLSPYLSSNKNDNPKILLVGCGNSTFGAQLYDAGYHDIYNIDYSQVVIDAMIQKYATTRPDMKWMCMDMTNMSEFTDGMFDVVIDKAAMDALMTREGDVWHPCADVIRQARQMCHHISRILKPRTGIHLHISFTLPHFRKLYLLGWHSDDENGTTETLILKKDEDRMDDYSTEFGWTYKVETIGGDDTKNDGCFHHFLYIMKKESR